MEMFIQLKYNEFYRMTLEERLNSLLFNSLLFKDATMLKFDWRPLTDGIITGLQSLDMERTHTIQKKLFQNRDDELLSVCLTAIYYKIFSCVQKKSMKETT